MMDINAANIKKMADELGANLCGIAPVERFGAAPPGHHPTDLLSGCKSVIVLAGEFPKSSLDADYFTYTMARNQMAEAMDRLAGELAARLKMAGVTAQVKRSMGGTVLEADNRYRDTLSLKHAALLAGLGVIGKNTLLITPQYGNMIWMSAVLVTAELEADPLMDQVLCPPKCTVCLGACPAAALGDAFMEQQRCFDYAYWQDNGAERIRCNACRKICPRCFGVINGKRG